MQKKTKESRRADVNIKRPKSNEKTSCTEIS